MDTSYAVLQSLKASFAQMIHIMNKLADAEVDFLLPYLDSLSDIMGRIGKQTSKRLLYTCGNPCLPTH